MARKLTITVTFFDFARDRNGNTMAHWIARCGKGKGHDASIRRIQYYYREEAAKQIVQDFLSYEVKDAALVDVFRSDRLDEYTFEADAA